MPERSARNIYQTYKESLQQIYSREEAESLTLMLLNRYLGLKRRDLLLQKPVALIPPDLPEALNALLKGMPIQYIFGEAAFFGRDFMVNSDVLIPRNETEELVNMVIKRHRGRSRILDIGTGSGCIAVTLSLELSESEVFGMDVSRTALEVARANALKLKARVSYFLADVLTEPLPEQDLDLIISNPPYVRTMDKATMHVNVLDHEPHLALFVADDDPLVFYRAIAIKGRHHLKSGGYIYFEINEALGAAVRALLSSCGYPQVHIEKDLNGKDRFAWAVNPG
ncbi:release factor glutamine methyltransferase [Cyclobacterium lianum]|uniref:Release factor glutamine methyltransferase n=1 Tax=Cyclobacterium lianum TaxID=388280 RepID=A0A1M7IAK5_9BACT|nr:peptide chain release factor N(5)-glutamine methyltransferase [Cyclobacterium lianum]SHM37618.1 release factor glutamine methyltransferase [Cyclobacterium lianum]